MAKKVEDLQKNSESKRKSIITLIKKSLQQMETATNKSIRVK